MAKNKIVHTIGKSHPGGASGGFFSFRNTSILLRVRNPDTPPTARGIATAASRVFVFFFMALPPVYKVLFSQISCTLQSLAEKFLL